MPTAKVIDVSSWQHPNGAPIDWHAVLEDGVQGVVVKLTQGVGYVNPSGIADLQEAERAGLLIGAYHFAEPGANSAADEASHFLVSLGGLDLTLGAWLDLEDLTGTAAHAMSQSVTDWLTAVQTPTRTAGLYTDRSIIDAVPGGAQGHRLWLAVPGATEQSPAGEWMTQTGTGAVSGITGGVDLDTVWNTRGLNLPPGAGLPQPVPPPPLPEPPAPPTLGVIHVDVPELQEGATGWPVKALQLVLRGVNAQLAVDSDFGPVTKAAVVEFQTATGLTPDGIVGPITWQVLMTGAKPA